VVCYSKNLNDATRVPIEYGEWRPPPARERALVPNASPVGGCTATPAARAIALGLLAASLQAVHYVKRGFKRHVTVAPDWKRKLLQIGYFDRDTTGEVPVIRVPGTEPPW